MVEYFATERLRTLYDRVERFLETHIFPNETEWLRLPPREAEAHVRSLRQAARETGAWNLYLDEKHSGPGLTLMEVAQLGEMLGRTPFGHLAFNCQAPDAGNVELLHQFGSDELKARYLEPLLRGDIRSCFSMTEPGAPGANPVVMRTTAVREGDDYVINGHKWFTSSGEGAAFAIVMAVTESDAPSPYGRASMLIVPTDNPGFRFVRNIPVMGEAGGGYFAHAEIRYVDCRVPATNLLGAPGSGFTLAQERLGPGRIHHCMRWVGIAERSFDLMCHRAATRSLGREMLGQKQMVQNMIATSRAEIDAARLMVLNAAWKMQHRGQRAAAHDISAIKFLVANTMLQVIDRAIQVHGALGVTDDTVLAYFYRHERGARIYDGPDEVHKAALARKILRGYGLEVKR